MGHDRYTLEDSKIESLIQSGYKGGSYTRTSRTLMREGDGGNGSILEGATITTSGYRDSFKSPGDTKRFESPDSTGFKGRGEQSQSFNISPERI